MMTSHLLHILSFGNRFLGFPIFYWLRSKLVLSNDIFDNVFICTSKLKSTIEIICSQSTFLLVLSHEIWWLAPCKINYFMKVWSTLRFSWPCFARRSILFRGAFSNNMDMSFLLSSESDNVYSATAAVWLSFRTLTKPGSIDLWSGFLI